MRGLSFPQFVDEILKIAFRCGTNPFCQNINAHWRPQYMWCAYCQIGYNVIGKAETFADDVKYIVLKQNLTSLIPLETTKKKTHATYKEAKRINYMGQLLPDQIRGLYLFYKRDFELFGYDISGNIQ